MNLKNKLTPITTLVFIIVFFVYVGSFLLIAYDNKLSFLGSSAEFFKAMVNTFQGAGAIAIITTIIIFFQSKIQSDIDKEKKVFDEKIKLYNSILTLFEEFFKQKEDESYPTIDQEERQQLFFWEQKVLLLSNKDTWLKFKEINRKITVSKGEINDLGSDIFTLVIEFAKEARRDLDLTHFDDSGEIDVLLSKAELKAYSNEILSSTFEFEGIKDDESENDINSLTHSIIKQLGEKNIEHIFTKTGGCTIKANGKKIMNIVPKKNFVELLIMRDYNNQYIRPEIEGLDISDIRKYDPTYDNHTLENPHPSYTVPWGYAFYKIKLDYAQISEYENKINELVQCGYDTIIDEKVLKITMADHQRLKNIYK